jgi:Integrase
MEHPASELSRKSARKVQGTRVAFSKADARYWLPRLFKWDESPNYSMQIQFKGRRMAFSLSTGNRDAAARRAAAIYTDLLAFGIERTLAKHRAQTSQERPAAVASVGQWIEAAQKVFDGKPASFVGYARALRLIAAEVNRVKKNSSRFGRGGGDYRRNADSLPLSILTPEAIQGWRISYVQTRGGGNPAKQRAARITCNSLVRLARSLFSARIRKFIPGLNLPEPLPFAGVEFYPRESMRYQSKIDPAALLKTAQGKLALANTEAFKALILALGAGLRRGEIDRLLWRQIDFRTGVIRVEATEVGDLKSEDSAGEVAIDKTLCGILQGFKAKARSQFVIEGPEQEKASSRAWGHAYRCTPTFDYLSAWLRKQGVDGNKPLHTLRKEAGAMVATRQGIYAASRFLRHSDIQVTAAHYADHKERVVVDISALLEPENVTPISEAAEGAKEASCPPLRDAV